MAVESLYIEPEQGEPEREWPALELLDVFKIYRSGPVETVALRGLDINIERGEVVALLFTVNDISVTLTKIERLLRGGDEEEEADEG